jgi:hypothetical protein
MFLGEAAAEIRCRIAISLLNSLYFLFGQKEAQIVRAIIGLINLLLLNCLHEAVDPRHMTN